MTRRAAAVRNRQNDRRRASQSTALAAILQPRKRFLLLTIALVVVTVALYYPVLSHPFLNFDDDVYVVSNRNIQAGLHWETVKWSFTTFRSGNWHPLTWLSHALDWQMFASDAGGHHATNLVLHVINVLLLFWVLRRATGYVGRSAMVAALFALHPVNVETVAWIAERKDLLSMTFFLLALAAYRWYATSPRASRYLTVAGFYALGLMAKPQVITLPCVLLLWDYWPLRRMSGTSDPAVTPTKSDFPPRSFSWLALEKIPLFALAAASSIVTIAAQYDSGSMTGPHWQPLVVRIENAIVAYARYLGKAVWPSNLAVLYPHPEAR